MDVRKRGIVCFRQRGVPRKDGGFLRKGGEVLDLEETMNGKFSLITVRNTLRVVSWTHKFL